MKPRIRLSPKARAAMQPFGDVQRLFEKTVVEMFRERGLHKTMTPVEIDRVLQACVPHFGDTLDEYATYVECEDWDTLYYLAKQEQTRRMIRGLA